MYEHWQEEMPSCEEEEVLVQVNACNLTMWDKAHLSYMKKLGFSEVSLDQECNIFYII